MVISADDDEIVCCFQRTLKGGTMKTLKMMYQILGIGWDKSMLNSFWYVQLWTWLQWYIERACPTFQTERSPVEMLARFIRTRINSRFWWNHLASASEEQLKACIRSWIYESFDQFFKNSSTFGLPTPLSAHGSAGAPSPLFPFLCWQDPNLWIQSLYSPSFPLFVSHFKNSHINK